MCRRNRADWTLGLAARCLLRPAESTRRRRTASASSAEKLVDLVALPLNLVSLVLQPHDSREERARECILNLVVRGDGSVQRTLDQTPRRVRPSANAFNVLGHDAAGPRRASEQERGGARESGDLAVESFLRCCGVRERRASGLKDVPCRCPAIDPFEHGRDLFWRI